MSLKDNIFDKEPSHNPPPPPKKKTTSNKKTIKSLICLILGMVIKNKNSQRGFKKLKF